MINAESQAKLKELRESGKWCCIEIYSDYHYVWNINLTHPGSNHETATIKSGCYEDLNDAVNEVYERALAWDGKKVDPKTMRDRR